MEYVVFQLYGPFAAWGDVAVGERRKVHERPSRSGLLGLVAAALGIDRTSSSELARLHKAYHVAVRVDRPGVLLIDYHTVQRPKVSYTKALAKQLGRNHRNRREELSFPRNRLATTLSSRGYRTDALAIGCVWPVADTAPWSVKELVDALTFPIFTPYLGRRACPLGLPLQPKRIEAQGALQALRSYSRSKEEKEFLQRYFPDNFFPDLCATPDEVVFSSDEQEAQEPGPVLTRRDLRVEGSHRYFDTRHEYICRLLPLDPEDEHVSKQSNPDT